MCLPYSCSQIAGSFQIGILDTYFCFVHNAAGTEVYINVPERWHITVFHTSQFDDTRPHPLTPVRPDLQRQQPAQRLVPTSADLQQEQETVQMVLNRSQPLVLEVRNTTSKLAVGS